MVEVEEVELDLALSIGGSFGKHTVEKPSPESKEEEARGDTREGVRVGVEPCEKREILAMRRMEAKKKREQKRERVRESCEHEWEPDVKREKIMTTECRNGVSGAWNTTPFRVQQFATVQYLPLNNGFPLPCWVGGEKNVSGVDGVNGAGGENRKAMSNGSSRCSSVVSDYQTSSREDGGSTDSHSHSVHSMAEPSPHMNTSKETTIPEDQTASPSSHPMRNQNNIPKQSHPNQQHHQQKPNPTTNESSLPTLTIPFDHRPSRSAKDHRPPKPLAHTQASSSLPQMPYVSTKGDNGKTVNGFLYKYTKSEVSIVCVCHGSTFSPAEFVQHAGGTDTTHPLKHITVTPSSAFGQ